MARSVFLLCSLIVTALCAYTPAKDKEIREETLTADSYDPLSRPTEVTHVQIGLNLLSVDDLNLPDQAFSAAGWLTVEWKDDRLIWNPSEKGDIKNIFADPTTIWHPELIVDNSIEELGVINDENLLLCVEHNGLVEWEPPMFFNVHCELAEVHDYAKMQFHMMTLLAILGQIAWIDVSYYPYDHQKCGIEVTSWGFTTSQVMLDHMFDGINLEDYRPNGQWKVVTTEVTKTTIHETRNNVTKQFLQLDFFMHMKRRYQFYNTNIMLPIILSSFLVTLVFIVPADCGEKLSYILTVLLTIAVFLTMISDTLPAISITTSILGIYLAATLCVATLATLITVGILFIYHKKEEPEPDSWLYKKSLQMGTWCRVLAKNGSKGSGKDEQVDEGRGSGDTPEGKKGRNLSWITIAEIWDRLCFYVFIVLTILVNVVFILILAIGGMASSQA